MFLVANSFCRPIQYPNQSGQRLNIPHDLCLIIIWLVCNVKVARTNAENKGVLGIEPILLVHGLRFCVAFLA